MRAFKLKLEKEIGELDVGESSVVVGIRLEHVNTVGKRRENTIEVGVHIVEPLGV